MADTEEKKMIDVCEADIEKVDDNRLDGVMGGAWDPREALVYKHKFETTRYSNMKPQYAIGYCENADMELEKVKYPCPVCGSWNVRNYDPGIFRVMRVVCYNCFSFKCRDGDEPWTVK